MQPVDAPAIAQPSTTGTVAVTGAETITPVKGQRYDPASAQPAAISTQLLTGKGGTASFKVATAPAATGAGATKVTTTGLAGPTASRTAVAEIGDIRRFSGPPVRLMGRADAPVPRVPCQRHLRERDPEQGSRMLRWAVTEAIQWQPAGNPVTAD